MSSWIFTPSLYIAINNEMKDRKLGTIVVVLANIVQRMHLALSIEEEEERMQFSSWLSYLRYGTI